MSAARSRGLIWATMYGNKSDMSQDGTAREPRRPGSAPSKARYPTSRTLPERLRGRPADWPSTTQSRPPFQAGRAVTTTSTSIPPQDVRRQPLCGLDLRFETGRSVPGGWGRPRSVSRYERDVEDRRREVPDRLINGQKRGVTFVGERSPRPGRRLVLLGALRQDNARRGPCDDRGAQVDRGW